MLAHITDERKNLTKIHLNYSNTICRYMTQFIVMGGYKIVNEENCCDNYEKCNCCNDLIGCRDSLYNITTHCICYDVDSAEWDDYWNNTMFICESCKDTIEDMILPYKNREITRRLLVAELPIIADICTVINAQIFALLSI
jgi:hypothetical protein